MMECKVSSVFNSKGGRYRSSVMKESHVFRACLIVSAILLVLIMTQKDDEDGSVAQVNSDCPASTGTADEQYAQLKKRYDNALGEIEALRLQLQTRSPAASSSSSAGLQSCLDFVPNSVRFGDQKCIWVPERYDDWPGMPPLCDYMNIECAGVTENERPVAASHLFGYGWVDFMMSQSDLMMMEFVFARYEYHRHIVELGTASGVTTTLLGVVAGMRGGELHSYDVIDQRSDKVTRVWMPHMKQHLYDLIGTKCEHLIKLLSGYDEPIFALFDNGDKVHEVNVYAQYLPKGSVMMVHDFRTTKHSHNYEITVLRIQPALDKYGFVEKYTDMANHLASGVRTFVKER